MISCLKTNNGYVRTKISQCCKWVIKTFNNEANLLSYSLANKEGFFDKVSYDDVVKFNILHLEFHFKKDALKALKEFEEIGYTIKIWD